MFDISPLRPTYFLLAEPQTSPKIAPPSFFYKLGGAKLHSTTGIFIDEATGHFVTFAPSVPSVQYKRAPGVASVQYKRGRNGKNIVNRDAPSYSIVESTLQNGPFL